MCGKADLEVFEICPHCEWQNDLYQLSHPDQDGCANRTSLNEARIAYKEGRQIR